MWWSRRHVVCAGLALGACGFSPVYGPGGSAEGLHGKVEIDPPRDASGFDFVRHMEARLGLSDAPVYRLSATLSVSESSLGITSDQITTRFQVIGRSRFRLIEVATSRTVTQGDVETFTSYSATGTPFATRAAQLNARERLMVALADQVVARLLVTRESWA